MANQPTNLSTESNDVAVTLEKPYVAILPALIALTGCAGNASDVMLEISKERIAEENAEKARFRSSAAREGAALARTGQPYEIQTGTGLSGERLAEYQQAFRKGYDDQIKRNEHFKAMEKIIARRNGFATTDVSSQSGD